MSKKLPEFFDRHRICIICEGNEEYAYLNRLIELNVWNEQYSISLVNAGGNGNLYLEIPVQCRLFQNIGQRKN